MFYKALWAVTVNYIFSGNSTILCKLFLNQKMFKMWHICNVKVWRLSTCSHSVLCPSEYVALLSEYGLFGLILLTYAVGTLQVWDSLFMLLKRARSCNMCISIPEQNIEMHIVSQKVGCIVGSNSVCCWFQPNRLQFVLKEVSFEFQGVL